MQACSTRTDWERRRCPCLALAGWRRAATGRVARGGSGLGVQQPSGGKTEEDEERGETKRPRGGTDRDPVSSAAEKFVSRSAPCLRGRGHCVCSVCFPVQAVRIVFMGFNRNWKKMWMDCAVLSLRSIGPQANLWVDGSRAGEGRRRRGGVLRWRRSNPNPGLRLWCESTSQSSILRITSLKKLVLVYCLKGY